MDTLLVDYLYSGEAWVLVGSGPSTAMGYPSWKQLADKALAVCRQENPGGCTVQLQRCHARGDYPSVFEHVRESLGGQRLLQALQEDFGPRRSGEVYESITRWPVSVYLTTSYDDEIQTHLAENGEAFVSYDNSEEHLSHLVPDLTGAVFKLHGDLRSERGLILTSGQYSAISESDEFNYWRTKMTSVFQMKKVIVVGHSLSDPNIRHVLEAAKCGAGVHQPVCWIAPDVPMEESREYLERFRIRVVSYDNSDGGHRSLTRLLESVCSFVPPRTSIRLRSPLTQRTRPLHQGTAASAGFYVFSKLSSLDDFEEKRVEVIVAAIEGELNSLSQAGSFDLSTALTQTGWPADVRLPELLRTQVTARCLEKGILEKDGTQLRVNQDALSRLDDGRRAFEHARLRFTQSIRLRLKRDFPQLTEERSEQIAQDIEGALVEFFREGGLTLATALFTDPDRLARQAIPMSVLPFINQQSTQYDSLLERQAFHKISIDTFVRPENPQKQYLGRIAQGFFGYHLLGVFGESAIEVLNHARETVWLIDSDFQIQVLALGAAANAAAIGCLSSLQGSGIRLFTTASIFREALKHLRFAQEVIEREAPNSYGVIAAARGQDPYPKANEFLDGFIKWQSIGNPCDWEKYVSEIFGDSNPSDGVIRSHLSSVGIEVVDLCDWPGFLQDDHGEREDYVERIVDEMKRGGDQHFDDLYDEDRRYRKAGPEAEMLLITTREREGRYHMLSDAGRKSSAWFVSHTSILNLIDRGPRITWQPEAFMRFVATLSPGAETLAEDSFEMVIWNCARSDVCVLDDSTVSAVFGGLIDQAELRIEELRQAYDEILSKKYGEPIESVFQRISPVNRPLAAIQLANEIALAQTAKIRVMDHQLTDESARRVKAEKELQKVDRYRRKVSERDERAKRNKRRAESGRKKGSTKKGSRKR